MERERGTDDTSTQHDKLGNTTEDPQKILVIASALDLEYRLGCTPQWWQLLKAFHEMGHEVIAVPYLGDPVESLWWRTYENPCSIESKVMNKVTENSNDHLAGRAGLSRKAADLLTEHYVKPRWRDHLHHILGEEHPVDLVLFLNVPLNHIDGLPTEIQDEYGVKTAYWDGDLPTILPEFAKERGFKFDYYEGADLAEYDAFFSNSKGAIPALEKRGAKNVHPLYWAADPELFQPLDIEKDIDVAFYGHGDEMREKWMRKMITEPSRKLRDRRFVVGGQGFSINLGDVETPGPIPYSAYDRFICRSKINLNITRSSHTNVYASATARPFELAAYGACMVSQPYEGMEEWFDPGEEYIEVESASGAVSAYEELLVNREKRERIGTRIREAIEDRHTFRDRVDEIMSGLRDSR